MTARMLLAEYFLTRDQAVILIAGPGETEPELVTVPCSLAAIRSQVATLSAALESAPRNPTALATVGELLSDDLLLDLALPLADRLQPGDRLWLVPHDALHRLPLHAIGTGFTNNAIAYGPSASVLRQCSSRRGSERSRALVLTDPDAGLGLTFGRVQAALLAELFSTSTMAGAEATSTALEQRLAVSTPDIIHVGAHGVFDGPQPMQSGIMLTDGRLTAQRFLDLNLAGALVVLAACRSGVSASRPGDELLGLVRSVLYAGAAAVLVSLWTVDELATVLLLARFYQGLASGEAAIDALHASQRHLRESTSAADVLAFLESVVPGVGEDARSRVQVAEARVRLAARDFDGAVRACDRAMSGLGDPGMRAAAESLGQRARLLANSGAEPDLDRRIYAHPYFWAAFILVGDWY